METLLSRCASQSLVRVEYAPGEQVELRAFYIDFPSATPDRLAPGTLSTTYTIKPLVEVDSESMFGELAICRCLASDGWDAIWVDTFHGGKFWRAMPYRGSPVRLSGPLRDRYDRVVLANGGKAAGFFDVMALRKDRIVHLEYKGAGDDSNRNERSWIAAALRAGVKAEDLGFVLHSKSRKASSSKRAAV